MTATLTADPTPDLGVADYYNRQPKRATSRLVALAPHVLLLARCEGAPETARYFEERLGSKVTEKMIKTIKSKVARGTLLVTREELEEAALSHPITAARLGREPSLCDPQHYRAAITPEVDEAEAPPAKKTAKKAAKKAPTKKAKQAPKKPDREPPAGDPPEVPAGKPAEDVAEEPTEDDAGEVEDRLSDPAPSPQPPTTGLQQIISDEELADKRAKLAEAKRLLRGEA